MCRLCIEGRPHKHFGSRRDFLKSAAATGIAAAGLDLFAPRETSGTQGSNPSSSSGESLANLIDVSSPVIAGQLLSSRGEKTAARGNCRNLCGGALLARSDEGRG